MLKGVTKSVIVVPSPDPSLFESAVFILRPGAVPDEEESRRRLLREAGEENVYTLRDFGNRPAVRYILKTARWHDPFASA